MGQLGERTKAIRINVMIVLDEYYGEEQLDKNTGKR